MTGIYKIQNKENGKIYIGQSINVERRLKEHQYPGRYKGNIPVDIAIHIHGKENFTYEIVEECPEEKLNERETYWISYYQSNTKTGYNCNLGGDSNLIGSENPNAKVSESDVIKIRTIYGNRGSKKDAFEIVKDKITWGNFESIWQGATWNHVMMDVYTPENKAYYSTGLNAISNRAYSDEEIIAFRKQYVEKSAREIYETTDKRITYSTFQTILTGRTFNHLPYYAKKHKVWVNPGDVPPEKNPNRTVSRKNSNQKISDEDIMRFRKMYVNMEAKEVYAVSGVEDKVKFEAFQKMLTGKTYSRLPFFSKKQQKWIEPNAVSTSLGSET